MQQLFGLRVQPIDARSDDGLHRRRHFKCSDVTGEAVRAPGAEQLFSLSQGVDDFLGVERITAGPLHHARGQSSHARVTTEQARDHFPHRLFTERNQRKLLVMRFHRPCGLVLGPEIE